ncbi:unnamed protein product [Paramecium primaurelia]|uniref:Amine oxidase domain-containing protein n=1 Tax=Paramecium primaurelia TaxID=5886 RepID=A0A8S1QEN3_PARPR|nr:unnamed protein product [Paramecium primaurelia]
MKKYDAIIIGGGHNALVAACYLKYKNILLLERRHITGGAAQTEEIYPGFKFSRFSYLLSLMRPSVINELNLYSHGLKLFRRPISSITVTKNKGEYLLMNSDSTFCKQEIAKFSKRDSEVYDEYNQFLSEIIDLWSYYQDKYPYDTSAKGYNVKKSFDDLGLLLKMGQDGWKNKDKIYDYIQFMSQSSSQFLNKWFESDILKGTLITDGIIGEMISIDTPASAYILLHHVMGEIFPNSKGEWAFVEGGMGSISKILTKLNEQKGVEIKTNIGVEQILTSNNQVTGVKCSDNNTYYSDTIISSVTPRITFEKLLSNDQQTKNPKYFNDVKHMEYNGACTKFNFAVSEMPKFKCFEGTKYEKPESVLIGTTHLGCERLDTLRQAYQDCINGKSFSDNLFVDLVVPTVHDKTIAPEGQHIVQCLVQYTPYKANWNEQIKQQLKEQVIDYISQYAPNFKKSILYTDMVTPQEIEQLLNMTEGNIFHGALTLDKLYGNRPSNGYNSYGTPINGLFLCGSGTHPGGGVMGAPGRNCALYINNYVK